MTDFILLLLMFVAGWLLISYSKEIADFIHLLVYDPPPEPPPPASVPPPPPPTPEEIEARIEELLKQNRK